MKLIGGHNNGKDIDGFDHLQCLKMPVVTHYMDNPKEELYNREIIVFNGMEYPVFISSLITKKEALSIWIQGIKKEVADDE